MNNLLKKILYTSTLFIIFIGIPVTLKVGSSLAIKGLPSLDLSSVYAETSGCTIQEATISPKTEQGSGGDDRFYSEASRNNKPVSISVYTTNCTGETIYVSLTSVMNNGAMVNESVLNKKPFLLNTAGTGAIRITLIPGEERCNISAGISDCRYQVRVGKTKDTYDYSSFNLKNGRLEYECETACYDKWIYKDLSSIPNPYVNPHIPKQGCSITWGTISPSTPKGSFEKDYYSDANRKTRKVSLKVYTSGCEKEPIYVALTQFNYLNKPTNGWVAEDVDGKDTKGNTNVSVLNGKPFTSETGAFEIQLYPGQEKCTSFLNGADCRYSMRLGVEPNKFTWSTRNEPDGNLDYECDSTKGTCPDKSKWEIISVVTIPNTPPNAPPNTTPNPTPVTNNTDNPTDSCSKEGCYETYSGLTEILGDEFKSFKEADDLSGFLNAIIGLVTGIAGVIAVAMIMYNGFLYMKTDNTSTKESTRSNIVNTVAGFVLLLSIYTLLRTINPDLLVLMPNIKDITIDAGTSEDATEALESAIEKNPAISKIYTSSKGHWRDAGSLIPKTESARKTKADSIPDSELYNLQTNGLTLKSGAGKFIHNSVGPKLKNLNTVLRAKGINLIVTEAFKPSIYKHFAACHYTATCIDGDIQFNANNVATLISEAQKAGLVAVWETKNASDYQKLINLGVPAQNVILFNKNAHITGDHFSIYDYQ